MEFLLLKSMVEALKTMLDGARIDKIQQPGKDRLMLKIYNGRENFRVVLDATPGDARLYITEKVEAVPQRPPRFCQLLRARLRRLSSVTLAKDDRVVTFSGTGPRGEPCRLVMELTGTKSNLILVKEDGTIADVLHRTPDDDVRPLRAGIPYHLPASGDRPTLEGALVQLPEGSDVEDWLQKVHPMPPLLKEVFRQAAREGRLPEVLKQTLEELQSPPSIVGGLFQGRPCISVVPITHGNLREAQAFDSIVEALQWFYDGGVARLERGGVRSERDQLIQAVQKQLKRMKRRKEEIARDEAEAGKLTEYQRYGSLILSGLHQIVRGETAATLVDYSIHPPEEVRVPLDSKLTPQENAERYFTRAKKIQRGADHRKRRLQETHEEERYLLEVSESLEEANSSDEIQWIRQELEQHGYLRQSAKGPRRAKPHVRALRQTTSPGGFPVFWGTNNRLNDLLIREVAKADDHWFHAHDLPGSHVILQNPRGEEVSRDDLEFAAGIAAGFSKGKLDALVDVKWTRVRFLKRPKGAKPGLVIVERFTVLRVPPRRPGEE